MSLRLVEIMCQPGDSRLPSAAALRRRETAFNETINALRVVEDSARRGIDDPHLGRLLHEVQVQMRAVPGLEGEPRPRDDSPGSRGAGVSIADEAQPFELTQLPRQLDRVEQGLRELEACMRLCSPRAAAQVEAVRHRFSMLGGSVARTARSQKYFQNARLYVLLDGCESEFAFTRLARCLIDGRADVLQFRDKQRNERQLLERARKLRELTRDTNTRFVVNDRPDLALLAEADGVHVGQEELPVGEVRRIVGDRLLVGVSTHSIEQARQAVLDGADYLGCGPTFPSTTKTFTAFPGLAFLREVAAEIRLPAFAIGGIAASRLTEVLDTGIGRVAIGAGITADDDPTTALRHIREQLDRHSSSGTRRRPVSSPQGDFSSS